MSHTDAQDDVLFLEHMPNFNELATQGQEQQENCCLNFESASRTLKPGDSELLLTCAL